MSVMLRKGWCPGALRPMPAKDGFLVRLRITGGILSAARARALADLAERCGNRLFDLTGRGNLQMRGIRDETLGTLQDGLAAIGLLDANAEAEAVRNVVASPLAGLHDGLDIRPLTAALEHRLATDTTLHALPGKFGFLVDDGNWPTLAGIDADVRFDWTGRDFAFGIGGTRAQAVRVGMCASTEVVGVAVRLALAFLEGAQTNPKTRRMRDVVDTVARAFGSVPDRARCEPLPRAEEESARTIVGRHTLGSGAVLGLAAPFGRLDSGMLRAAANAAADELRLTPWRVLLLPDAAGTHVPVFISEAADPRLAVEACVGSSGCANGSTDTHVDASILADALPENGGITLHVSGCGKGCAKPSRTPFTLVARAGRYDLVRHGRAGDAPARHDLDLAEVRDALRALA